MVFSKADARDRLREVFPTLDHPGCSAMEMRFVDEDTDRPDRDGVLVVECWNCPATDHFLYTESED